MASRRVPRRKKRRRTNAISLRWQNRLSTSALPARIAKTSPLRITGVRQSQRPPGPEISAVVLRSQRGPQAGNIMRRLCRRNRRVSVRIPGMGQDQTKDSALSRRLRKMEGRLETPRVQTTPVPCNRGRARPSKALLGPVPRLKSRACPRKSAIRASKGSVFGPSSAGPTFKLRSPLFTFFASGLWGCVLHE